MRRASILPEVPEPFTGKLGVPNGVLDVLVPEVVLQGPRVSAVIGEFARSCTSHLTAVRGSV
jgi:hypothetical protein